VRTGLSSIKYIIIKKEVKKMQKELVVFEKTSREQSNDQIKVKWTSKFSANAKYIAGFIYDALVVNGNKHYWNEKLEREEFSIEDREGNNILKKIREDLMNIKPTRKAIQKYLKKKF
jgi:hypothetical protein